MNFPRVRRSDGRRSTARGFFRLRQQWGPAGWAWVAVCGAWLLTGCAHRSSSHAGPYLPTNVRVDAAALPAAPCRVAVLPLSTSLEPGDDNAAREILEPILQVELAKTKRFELVNVSVDRLQQSTGRARWRADEKLPSHFLTFLREAYACNAVLFSQVTAFRAYPPLAVGWRFRLVTADGSGTPWAADEVFDCGQTAVAQAARLYQQKQQQSGSPADDAQAIMNSPRRFGHYSASALLDTLPKR